MGRSCWPSRWRYGNGSTVQHLRLLIVLGLGKSGIEDERF